VNKLQYAIIIIAFALHFAIVVLSSQGCSQPTEQKEWVEWHEYIKQITMLQNKSSALEFENATLNMTLQQKVGEVADLEKQVADFNECRQERGNLQADVANKGQELANIRTNLANAINARADYEKRFNRSRYEATQREADIVKEKEKYTDLLTTIKEFGANITATTNITDVQWAWWYKTLEVD